MDHVFQINDKFSIGSLALAGTLEGFFAGELESIIDLHIKKMNSWESKESGYFFKGGVLNKTDVFPKYICEFVLINNDFDFLEIKFFTNSSLRELENEIAEIVLTEQFQKVFEERCFQI
jgi:hypothetical protein